MPITIEFDGNQLAEKLDELADLAQHWQRHRSEGRTPTAIRAGMMQAIKEINARDQVVGKAANNAQAIINDAIDRAGDRAGI